LQPEQRSSDGPLGSPRPQSAQEWGSVGTVFGMRRGEGLNSLSASASSSARVSFNSLSEARRGARGSGPRVGTARGGGRGAGPMPPAGALRAGGGAGCPRGAILGGGIDRSATRGIAARVGRSREGSG